MDLKLSELHVCQLHVKIARSHDRCIQIYPNWRKLGKRSGVRTEGTISTSDHKKQNKEDYE